MTRRRTALTVLAAATLVAAIAGSASHAAGSRRTGTIAFLRLDKGPGFGASLFVVRPDGTGLRQLTPEATRVWAFYAWSPDGRLIAYIDQHRHVWLVGPDGSGRRLLPNAPAGSEALSWSPDGTRIAVTAQCPRARCSRLRLYVVPISGGPAVRLPVGRQLGWNAVSWSPAGDEIYYGGSGIWTIRPDGTGNRRISVVGGAGALSADGSQFLFNVPFSPRSGNTDRYRAFAVVNADGTGYHMVTSYAYNEYGEVWSPTGHRILYGRAGSQGIYVIGPTSRDNRRVTRDAPPRAGWPALGWSPDGGSIVYDAGTYTSTHLYVIGVDGRNKVQLTSGPELDIAPSWVAR